MPIVIILLLVPLIARSGILKQHFERFRFRRQEADEIGDNNGHSGGIVNSGRQESFNGDGTPSGLRAWDDEQHDIMVAAAERQFSRNIDTFSPRQVVFVFAAFIFAYVLAVGVAAVAAPDVLQTATYKVHKCSQQDATRECYWGGTPDHFARYNENECQSNSEAICRRNWWQIALVFVQRFEHFLMVKSRFARSALTDSSSTGHNATSEGKDGRGLTILTGDSSTGPPTRSRGLLHTFGFMDRLIQNLHAFMGQTCRRATCYSVTYEISFHEIDIPSEHGKSQSYSPDLRRVLPQQSMSLAENKQKIFDALDDGDKDVLVTHENESLAHDANNFYSLVPRVMPLYSPSHHSPTLGSDAMAQRYLSSDVKTRHTVAKKKDIVCRRGNAKCDSVLLVRYMKPSSSEQAFSLSLALTNSTEELSVFDNEVLLDIVFKNGLFVVFEAVVRMVSVSLSVCILIASLRRLTQWPVAFWTNVHFWLIALLLMAVGFNDPLFVAVFIGLSPLLTHLVILFRVTFSCAVFVFWIVVVEYLLASHPHRRFTSPFFKIVFGVNLWFAATLHYFQREVFPSGRRRDQFLSVSDSVDSTFTLHLLHVWLVATLAAVLLWFAYSTWKGFDELRKMQRRFRALYALTLVVTIACVISYSNGFDRLLPASSVVLVSDHGLVNLYLCMMAVCLLPASEDWSTDAADAYDHRTTAAAVQPPSHPESLAEIIGYRRPQTASPGMPAKYRRKELLRMRAESQKRGGYGPVAATATPDTPPDLSDPSETEATGSDADAAEEV